MAGKDISEMSFDEFFMGRRERPPKRERTRPEASEKPPEEAPADEKPEAKTEEKPEIDGSMFRRGRPKVNVIGGEVFLYVPKYEGGRRARYEVSVEQGGATVPLGSLNSSPLDSDVSSIPTKLPLGGTGVDPLGEFVVVIDGKRVYEMFAHSHMMFSPDGMPISRAADEMSVLYPKDKHLWLSSAKVTSTTEVDDLRIDTVEVGQGGYVRVRDRPQEGRTAPAPEKPAPAKKAPKPKPSGTLTLPAPESAASAATKDGALPLYPGVPEVVAEARGADPSEFTVKVESKGGTSEVPLPEFSGLGDAVGKTTVTLRHGGKAVAKEVFFVLPGFSCSYSAKGDIPDCDTVSFTVGGEELSHDVHGDQREGPFKFEGGSVELLWNIPAVTVDLGSGPVPLSDAVVQVDDLPDVMRVSARGVSKRSVFLAGTGRKVDITPDWTGDEVGIDCGQIREAVFDSPTRSASLYITVNSCPVRRFLTVENTAGTAASYGDGRLTVTVTGAGEHVCRLFKVDRSVETVALSPGENEVPVGPEVIVAEVAEIRDGRQVAAEEVRVREIPFLLRDPMGDVWFYVSKDKRIPIPDGLQGDAEIKKWHSQIVRMNPELKAVGPEQTVKAFRDFAARRPL